MSADVITSRRIELLTSGVSVKVMTMGSRQLTVTVFRQLIDERLISHDGHLKGQPMAFVNYHTAECKDIEREHLHVVWAGSRGPRCSTIEPPSFGWFFPPTGQEYLQAIARRLLPAGSDPLLGVRDGSSVVPLCKRHGIALAARMDALTRDAVKRQKELDWFQANNRGGNLKERIDSLAADRDRALEALTSRFESVLLLALDAEASAEAERRERHSRLWADLRELEQAFIGGLA